MEASSSGFLQRILSQLSFKQSLTFSEEASVPVAVVAIQRYLSDDNNKDGGDAYSYDVTLTDGAAKLKCLLRHTLNGLVQTNTLRTGHDVTITQCSFVYSERKLAHGFVRLDQILCGSSSGRSRILDDVRDLSLLPTLVKPGMENSEVLHRDLPLQPSRKHYLALWNDDDPEGDLWTSGGPSSDRVLDVSKINLLSHLDSSRKTMLPLLVRIIHKSKLRYYGKPGCKVDVPYQAYFEVADQTGTMSLVLWNELCPQFYQKLCTGTVLHLQNYALKPSYSKRSRPQMDHYRFSSFKSVEICLNARNPASVITVVSPKKVQPQWGLPQVSYQFIRRAEVDSLASNWACDVIGLVMFVGRVQRVKSKGNPEKFWTYRWVHAVDETSEQPFVLELFSASQPQIFNSIAPMSYLVCTQMRVCQVEGSPPYLTSSFETRIFTAGHHKGQPYVGDPRVKSFIQWTKTLKDNAVLEKTAVGGHYSYPHLPRTFSLPEHQASVPLVAASELKTELEGLRYREHKKLAVQGEITVVRYARSFWKEPPPGQVEPAAEQSEPQRSASPTTEDSPGQRKRRRTSRDPTVPTSSEHEDVEESEQQVAAESHSEPQGAAAGDDELCWQSSKWSQQRPDVGQRLSLGGLYQQSVSRRFSLEETDEQLQWTNMQPSRWTPGRRDTLAEEPCPGHFLLTILGINKQISIDATFYPVTSSRDPRAVGLTADPHDNTMLSCLSSGYTCPLGGGADQSASSEESLKTASELEDTTLVCVLDLCHLGGREVEVLVSKVYRLTSVSDR